jgi:hypothetical protein
VSPKTPPKEVGMKPASLIAVLVFSLVAIAHLLRLVFQAEVLVGGATIPMWVSAVGLLVAGVLAVALWREAQPSNP